MRSLAMHPRVQDHLLDQALRPGRDRPAGLRRLLESLDWRDVAQQNFRVEGAEMVFEARAAAQPRTLVFVGDDPDRKRSASVGYSREAPYSVIWGAETVEFHDVRLWNRTPGDSPLLQTGIDVREGLRDLLDLIRRPEVLADVPGGLDAEGTRHPDLPQRLATALTTLRLQVADAQAYAGSDIAGRDAAVLALFHQLLYIRVVEDRRSVQAPERVADLLHGEEVAARLEHVSTWYAQNLDSELFEPSGVRIADLPGAAFQEVLQALVQPWKALHLDFSVSQSELAGRLYESYLSSVPVAGEDPELRLFPAAKTLDRRDAQASFYTPPGLAKAVVDRTLSAYVRGRDIDPFSIRILDPACGSGAFLLAAFRWLCGYAVSRLGHEPTAAQRGRLLVDCLFGADVDERALALTRVQLLEEAELVGRLPSLKDNLLLGDSLAAPPGAPEVQKGDTAVDWSGLLAQVGPFSAVIGNPPFGSEAKLPRRLSVASIRLLDSLYPEVRGFGRDYAYVFGALALRLLAADGTAGLVMPRKLLEGTSGRKLRALLSDRGLDWVADLRAAALFPGVKTRACVVVLDPRGRSKTEIASVVDSREEPSRALDDLLVGGATLSVRREKLSDAASRGWSAFRLRWERDLRRELTAHLDPLAPEGHPARDARFGTKPARVDKLVLGPNEWEQAGLNKVRVNADGVIIAERYVPLLVYARDIRPFVLKNAGRRLLLPFEADGTRTSDAAVGVELARRGGLPPNFQRGDLGTLLKPKVLLRAVAREPAAVADLVGRSLPIMRGALAIRADDLSSTGLEALAALLNSALYQWLLRGLGAPLHDESVELSAADVRALPVPALTEEAVASLTQCSHRIVGALSVEDLYLRAREYRRHRHKLDTLVFDLVGATPRLRDVVLDELIREA